LWEWRQDLKEIAAVAEKQGCTETFGAFSGYEPRNRLRNLLDLNNLQQPQP